MQMLVIASTTRMVSPAVAEPVPLGRAICPLFRFSFFFLIHCFDLRVLVTRASRLSSGGWRAGHQGCVVAGVCSPPHFGMIVFFVLVGG